MKYTLCIKMNGTELPAKTYAISAVALDSDISEEAKDFFFKFTACLNCSREEQSGAIRRHCEELLNRLCAAKCISVSPGEAEDILTKMIDAARDVDMSVWSGTHTE